jgi:hypothetical protein
MVVGPSTECKPAAGAMKARAHTNQRFLIATSDGAARMEPRTDPACRLHLRLGASESTLLARTKVVKHTEPVAIQILGRELPQIPRFGF